MHMLYKGIIMVINYNLSDNLLKTLFWEEHLFRAYRIGNRSMEKYLTKQVFRILDFLPRKHFLGEIIKSLNINDEYTKSLLYSNIENNEFSLLPSNHYMREPFLLHKNLAVDSDKIVESLFAYTIGEANRMKPNAFRKKQFVCKFSTVIKKPLETNPLLLLILGNKPPVLVIGSERKHLKEGIIDNLSIIHDLKNSNSLPVRELNKMVNKHLAWTTWEDIMNIVIRQYNTYETDDPSDKRFIRRLCDTLVQTIQWYS